jgi:MSHA pilin protein MshD
MCISRARKELGVSLLELIIAIAIVGIALAGAVSVFVVTTQHSADPMSQEQAQLVAEAYLDEILLKKFYDPDTGTVCTGTTGGETRPTYDNVCDYNGLSEQPTDQFGTAIAGLSSYNVAVSVVNAGVSLGAINNTGAIRVLRVDVTVSLQGAPAIVLSAYRTNYACNPAGTAAQQAECKPI